MMYRVPAQQYHRGISRRNCRILRGSEDGKWNEIPLNFDALEGYVNKPQYTHFGKAPTFSSALSDRFTYFGLTGAIHCDNKKIGHYREKENRIECVRLLAPELERVIRKSHLTNPPKIN